MEAEKDKKILKTEWDVLKEKLKDLNEQLEEEKGRRELEFVSRKMFETINEINQDLRKSLKDLQETLKHERSLHEESQAIFQYEI